jgi:hypothetical protein|tara:strand:+ start:1323 stop:1688 length:366 start_codon:yes stop_codon:yes gene_type:complete
MSELASELDSRCRAAGLAIDGVSIGTADDKTSWTVQPSAVQSAAQPIIDAFDITAYGLDWEWSELRTARNLLLTDCDWTQLGDAQLTGAQVTEWQTYRQVLRDLPSTTLDPAQPDWPIPPE